MSKPHDPYAVEKRKPLTPKQRMQLFVDRGGVCCECGGKIHVGEKWIDEHINPLSRTGSNNWDNRGIAHEKCARKKTSREATERSKVRSVAAKHFGAGKTSKGRPMAGTKASGWKKKLDGTVVRRDK
jgi:5-methylcytosine-specific restriction endonuclease McrA